MFENLKSENSLLRSFNRDLTHKKLHPEQSKKILKDQLKQLDYFLKKEQYTDLRILTDISTHFQEEQYLTILQDLNASQMHVFIDSLRAETALIKQRVQKLQETIQSEFNAVSSGNTDECKQLFQFEEKILLDIEAMLAKDLDIRKKLKRNLEDAAELEHKEWFMHLMKGMATVMVRGKYKLIVEGEEHVPQAGPVIIAPRHVHGTYDPSVMYNIFKRRIFFLGAVDWMDEKEAKINKDIFFKNSGVVPVVRPDAKEVKTDVNMKKTFQTVVSLLNMGQAVIIFPEGWPIIDDHYTVRTDTGIGKVEDGVFHFAKMAQTISAQQIPIVPVDMEYIKERGIRETVYVRIGEPFFVDTKGFKQNLAKYNKKLKEELKELSHVA